MVKNKEYKPENYHKRKSWYSVAETAGIVVLAGLITYGLFTLEDVTNFVELLDTLAGIAAAAGLFGAARVARNNVEPPAEVAGVHAAQSRTPQDD